MVTRARECVQHAHQSGTSLALINMDIQEVIAPGREMEPVPNRRY